MESPATWDLLTSCIATSDLEQVAEVWAFLVDVGVGHDGPGHRERFAEAALAELARGPITGGSTALRIACRLDRGLLGPRAHEADPNGQRAMAYQGDRANHGHARPGERWAPPPAPVPLELDTLHCTRCGRKNQLRYHGGDEWLRPCVGCNRRMIDPIDLLAELGRTSATHRLCPRCARANVFHRHCWGCGYRFPE